MLQEEITIDLANISTMDVARGLIAKTDRVERNDFMHSLSRKQLEEFLRHVVNYRVQGEGVISFNAIATFTIGDDEFECEPVTVEVSLKNNRGRIRLHKCRKLAKHGYPVQYDTRSEMVRTDSGELFILGHSRKEGDFALWITQFKRAA